MKITPLFFSFSAFMLPFLIGLGFNLVMSRPGAREEDEQTSSQIHLEKRSQVASQWC